MQVQDIIINQVCGYFNRPVSKVISKNRKEIYRFPRQVIQYFIKEKTNLSLEEIGFITGSFSHSAVHVNHKQLTDQLSVDKHFRSQMHEIEDRIEKEIYKNKHQQFRIYEFHVEGETVWICARTIFESITWYCNEVDMKFDDFDILHDNITEVPLREWDKLHIYDPQVKTDSGKPVIIESFYSYMLRADKVDCIASTLY